MIINIYTDIINARAAPTALPRTWRIHKFSIIIASRMTSDMKTVKSRACIGESATMVQRRAALIAAWIFLSQGRRVI